MAKHCSTMLRPMVAIITVKMGLLIMGRKTARFRIYPNTVIQTRASRYPQNSGRSRAVVNVTARKPPSIRISPWAILRMPTPFIVITNPSPISA